MRCCACSRRRARRIGGSTSGSGSGGRSRKSRYASAPRTATRPLYGAVEHRHAGLGQAHRDRIVAKLRVVGDEGHGLGGRLPRPRPPPRRSRRSGSSDRECPRRTHRAPRCRRRASARKQCSNVAAKSAPVPHASSGLFGTSPGSSRVAIARFVVRAPARRTPRRHVAPDR